MATTLEDCVPLVRRHSNTLGKRPAAASIGSMISRADVEHVAALARLGLTDAELDRMVTQLNHILEAIAVIQDVDTSSVGPTAQVIPLENVMREDAVRDSIERDAALANAPLREGAHLRVAVVLEEGR